MDNLVLIARALQESEYTANHVRLLLRDSVVKGEKVGGVWLVDMDDLKRYEREMRSLGSKRFDPTRGESKS